MSLINQYSRISHHTVTTTGIGSPGLPFTVPSTEDFTNGTWTATDLALSEFGINEADQELFIRIDDTIFQVPLIGGPTPPGYTLWEAGTGLDSIKNVNSGNISSGIFSLATGFISTVSGDYSFTGGGFDNTVTSYASAIVGGENGQVTVGGYSAIIGGLNNYVSTDKSVIIGGDNNSITGVADLSVILGGNNIVATAANTAYVPYLNIGSAFVWAGTETDLLIRNSAGEIKLIPISDLTTDLSGVATITGTDVSGLTIEWLDLSSSPGIDPKIVLDATGIRFDHYNGDYYTFPVGDGTVDQVMVTDGAGQMSWTNLVYENTSTNSIIPTYASGNNSITGSTFSVISSGTDNSIVSSIRSIIGGGGGGVTSGNTINNSDYAFIGAGSLISILAVSDYSSISSGLNNTINDSSFAFIGSGGSAGTGNLIDNSDNSFIGAGDNIIINDSSFAVVAGGGDNEIINTSTSSFIGAGADNVIDGSINSAIVAGGSGGVGNTITGSDYAFIGAGRQNSITSDYASILGGNSAVANHYGQRSYAAGDFGSTSGSAQQIDLILRNSTTNATPTQLFLNGSSLKLTVTSGNALACSINVCGIEDDGNESAHYMRKVLIKNVGGTTSLVGTVQTIGTDVESNILLDLTITANNTDDTLDIEVTGLAATNMNWVAHVSAVEIAYAA